MIEVKECPFCKSKKREETQKQEFRDIYIDLIKPDLNEQIRYWYECNDCKFLYRSPKLDEEEQEILYEKYRDVSFRSETPDDYFDRITGYNNKESENFNKVSWFLNNTSRNFKDQKFTILDVGCGGGVLVHKIKEMLPQALTYGVEPNDLYSNLARNRSCAQEIKTSYFYKDLFDHKFDLIVSSDVLEHVDKPDQFLGNIYDSLDEKGVLFLEIPSPTNFSELDKTHDMFNIAHHVFYTEDILENYLQNIGFKDILIQDYKNQNNGVYKLRVIAYKK